ncbi:SDR family oxidoreductase [Variovorax rhizosphaerae]|uniref:SDR family oxidoreductase n=1 Tax=Variovorax rhizosphaerae TaxID=1836200 RepID=A0ABU8WLB9_9BURK
MSADLKGKVAIITGSTQGVGADIARVLSESGAHVVVVGRNKDAGHELVWELTEQPGAQAIFCAMDIEQDAHIDQCVKTTLERFGRIDILVNNACIYTDEGIASSRAQWHQTLGVNLVSAAIFSQKVLPHMQRGSVIVNLGSVGGKFGSAGRALYPASKAAMLQLTKSMAVTVAPQGIRVVAVSPAWTWSPSVESLSEGSREHADAVAAPLHPLGRVGDGAEVGNVVAFVCSDAASWITGVDIPVDGGYSVLGPDQGLGPRVWFERSKK